MKDAAAHSRFEKNAFGVLIRVACVNNGRQAQFFRNLKLPPKNLSLNVAGRMIVVVVEPGLANREDLPATGKVPHQTVVSLFNFGSIVRMDADTGGDPVVLLRDGEPAAHVIRTAAIS